MKVGGDVAVMRLARGNRRLARMRRSMDIKTATGVTLGIVEAGHDRLVIGPSA